MYGLKESRADVLRGHACSLKYVLGMAADQGGQCCVRTTANFNMKSAVAYLKPPAVPSLTPVHVANLGLDVTHRGRVLRGTLLVDPCVMSSVDTVLEDEHGDVVRVSLYNFLADSSNTAVQFRRAQQMFPKGTKLAIIEPHYKRRMDGSNGIRVDNPEEVVWLTDLGPTSAAEWQEDGKRHFQAQQYEEAARCYSWGIQLATGSGLLPAVLLNLSATHLKLLQPGPALWYACAALAVAGNNTDGSRVTGSSRNNSGADAASSSTSRTGSAGGNSKMHYRMSLALDALDCPLAARCSMTSAIASDKSLSKDAQASMWMQLALSSTSSGNVVLQPAKGNAAAPASPKTAAQPVSNPVQQKEGRTQMLQALAGVEWLPLLPPLPPPLPAPMSGSSGSSHSLDRNSEREGKAAAKAIVEPPAVMRARSSKERGNVFFTAGNYAQALSAYEEALSNLKDPTAILLSNRAACMLLLPERLHDALIDASAAIAVDPSPSSIKAHHRRVQSLLRLEWLTAAAAAVKLALRAAPADASIPQMKELEQRIASLRVSGGAIHTKPAGAGGTATSTEASSGVPAGKSSTGQRSGKGKRKPKGAAAAGDVVAEATASTPATLSSGFSATTGSSNGSSTSARTSRQRQMQQLEAEESTPVETLAMMNQMMEMAEKQAATRAQTNKLMQGFRGPILVEKRVLPFHDEFSAAGKWPAQCDISACRRHLWNAYETARGIHSHEMSIAKLGMKGVPRMDVMKMLRVRGQEDMEQLMSETGTVRFWHRMPYEPFILHSFGNTPNTAEKLTLGTTHVAVGFLDLGDLAAACTVLDPTLEVAPTYPGGTSRPRVLRWVGYDASAYAVAKTLVLAHMMRSGADIRHVLQVWYSATWSKAAHATFRTALTALILHGPFSNRTNSSNRSSNSSSTTTTAVQTDQLPAAVLRILHHWQSQEVPLKTARVEWFASINTSGMLISNFKRKKDRLALSSYRLSGDLPESAVGPAEVGSVIMFAIPPDLGERAHDESFLQTIPFEDLWRQLLGEQQLDVVEAGTACVHKRISALAMLLKSGQVQVEVRMQAVTPAATAVHAEIRALHPYTMSWSNVPDYINPADFHVMARACSAPEDTVHFLHSMNWPLDVQGASHLHYLLLSFDNENNKQLCQLFADMMETAEQATSMMITLFGLRDMLLHPPLDNPRNLLDYSFMSHRYQAWISAFFAAGHLLNFERQVGKVSPPTYNILSRANSTLHMTYTYDPEINFASV